MKKFLFTIISQFLCILLYAQNVSIIGTESGLKNPTVYSVVQDQWGFVWIGTRDGLYRYNEGQAELFNFQDSTNVIRSNNIQSLLCTNDSILYVGMQLGGIVSVDLKNFRPISDQITPQLPEATSVISLYESANGTIWAGTSGTGIFYLKPNSGTWKQLLSENYFEELKFCFDFAEQGDTLWIASSGQSILYYLNSTEEVSAYQSADELSSYRKAVDVKGTTVVVAIEGQGVYKKSDQSTFKKIDVINGASPRDLRIINNELWISTDGAGVYVYDGIQTKVYSKHDDQVGIITDQCYGIYSIYDQVWVGTFNGGITAFPSLSDPLIRLPKPSSFSYSSLQSAISLLRDEESLWVGFDGDGIVRYEFKDGSWIPFYLDDESLPSVVTCIESFDSQLWVGSLSEGLFVLGKQDNSIKRRFLAYSPLANGLQNSNIWSIERTWGDSLWIGTLYGLQFWNGKEFLSPFRTPWEVGRNIMDLEFDGQKLWVGSEFQGTYSIDRLGKIESFPLDNPVLDLLSFEKYILIGTEGSGILAIHNGKVDTITRNQEYLNCYSLTSIGQTVFASTSLGLLELQLSKDQEWSYNIIKEFNELNIGLPNRKALLSVQNSLIMGGTEGVLSIDMNNQWKAELPVILLTEVHTDNIALNTEVFKDEMRQKSPISIPAGTKNIRFTFDLMSKTRRNGIACAYRVKELSDIWISLPYGTRNIDLNDLYPGQYTLDLRLKGQGNQEKLIKIDFKLEPYLTQRVWFRGLLFTLVVFVLGFSAFLLQERKHRSTRLRLIETEKKLLESKAAQLEIKSKQQQNELSFQLLKTSSRLELLKSFKERLMHESEKKDRSDEVLRFLKGLTRELNRELQSENYWDHFERNYRELHENFSKSLMEHYPNLTKGEVRICYLIRQKMSNKEIANVLNVSPAAVEKAKYRLKKKVDLNREVSLDEFIQKL